jgi:type I restriction enzyme S subunit
MRALDVRSAAGEEELLTVSSSRGVVPRASAQVNMFKAESYAGHKLCWPGDLVINSLWAWGRGLGVAQHHGIVSTAYGVYRQHGGVLNADYLHQLVRSEPFQWELQVRSQGVWKSRLQITDDRWLDAPLLVPAHEEQAAIVKYLTHANARIDKAIAAKRHLTALLEEQYTAQVVGVFARHESDAAPLLPLKRLVNVKGGMTPSKENQAFWGGDIPWVSPKDVKANVLLDSIDHITQEAFDQTNISLVPRGAVVVVVRGMILARTVPVATLGVMSTLNQDMKALVPHGEMLSSEYLRDWLRAHEAEVIQLVETAGHGTKKLDTDRLMNLRLPVPALAVQEQLSARVDAEGAATRTTVMRIRAEITLLQEFRTRLVADVVTGQVDVRAIAATLPDAPESFNSTVSATDDDFEEALSEGEE